MIPHDVLAQLETLPWSDDGEPVDTALVHKTGADNVLVARMMRRDGHPHDFLAEMRVPRQHPFFFEHAVDHVPGLLLIEAGRQLAIALAHRFYEVPSDAVFVLDGLQLEFQGFAELGVPLYGWGTVREPILRKGVLTRMKFGGLFIQDGRCVTSMHGGWTMLPKPLYERMRRSGGPAAEGPATGAAATPRAPVLG